jgi:hypothetical protein
VEFIADDALPEPIDRYEHVQSPCGVAPAYGWRYAHLLSSSTSQRHQTDSATRQHRAHLPRTRVHGPARPWQPRRGARPCLALTLSRAVSRSARWRCWPAVRCPPALRSRTLARASGRTCRPGQGPQPPDR